MFCHKCGTRNPDNGKFCRSCGSDLAVISDSQKIEPITPIAPVAPGFYIDRRGRVRSNDPDDLWSAGLRNTIMGIGFLIVSLSLLITNVANGQRWWWAMLFPAFSLLASGVGNLSKSKRIEKKNSGGALPNESSTLYSAPKENANLPPAQTEFVKPQRSIYDTGEFAVPPSVTENTTRHLEIDNEGETMTLPEK